MTPLTVLHLAANRWWTGSADPIIQLVLTDGCAAHTVTLGPDVAAGERPQAIVPARAVAIVSMPIEIEGDVFRGITPGSLPPRPSVPAASQVCEGASGASRPRAAKPVNRSRRSK